MASISEARFLQDVTRNRHNAAILARWQQFELPNLWLVAGCLFQTVWNLHLERPAEAGIKDYDFFYFDPQDLSAAAEQQAQRRVAAVLSDLDIAVEVANQARVHLWYPEHFKRPYPTLASVEEGISRFLVLETCVAVRPGECIAPNGFDGLYAGTLTPNPMTPYPELFAAKAASYHRRWSFLSVVGERSGSKSLEA